MNELSVKHQFMALSKDDKRLIGKLRKKMEHDSCEKKSLDECLDLYNNLSGREEKDIYDIERDDKYLNEVLSKLNNWKKELDLILSEFNIKVKMRQAKKQKST